MKIKSMGVMNLTPNSFSDGGEVTARNLKERIHFFNQFDVIDIGAESTAPMNEPITPEEEWRRLEALIPYLGEIKTTLSVDTYHPETIFRMTKLYSGELIWNDISGKFDESVEKFLSLRKNLSYVFCHNLAPSREDSIRHMNFLSPNEDTFIDELVDYFLPYKRSNVIFDPCLGFSKSYSQNWKILDQFHYLQKKIDHSGWLIGFSRKSFLRKKYQLELSQREELDLVHIEELKKTIPTTFGEVIIRTHRPELLALI